MYTEALLRIGAAMVIGMLIGLNREAHHKAAGFRTLGILAVGVALATFSATTMGDDAAASRVIQGILAGVGFLGAGVIVRHSDAGNVEGLTTAASIWTTAAISAACGLGAWPAVALGSGFILLLLTVGHTVEARILSRSRAAYSEDASSRSEEP